MGLSDDIKLNENFKQRAQGRDARSMVDLILEFSTFRAKKGVGYFFPSFLSLLYSLSLSLSLLVSKTLLQASSNFQWISSKTALTARVTMKVSMILGSIVAFISSTYGSFSFCVPFYTFLNPRSLQCK